ncbi:flagella basal body P-ring formation protein FlgA [Desulfobacula phenolica]|uniref:Flagella basal body P-ring formation protein FlgA n=2 Tax=Desulfobacula phenolica TaxID=90732 RepID=A0A1H2DSA9_9BACT|nr:flagella basal body P-ring formation protein FlgA [Desulfobacula phenolica]
MGAAKLNIKLICFFIIGIMAFQSVWTVCLFANNDNDENLLNSDIRITIKETNLVKQSQVFLGDISEIQANGFLKEALAKIVVSSSPKPDQIKSFDKKKIISIIRGQRYLPDNIIMISPRRIYVKRLGQVISKQDVRQFVEQYLSQIFKNQDYQLKTFNVRGLETYPQGKLQFCPDSDDMLDKHGKLSFYLDVVIDGNKEDRLSVSGLVALYDNVLHTTRSYAKGETISKETVCLKKENVFEIGRTGIKTFEEISHKILNYSVRKGDILKTNFFADPPLIQKGDIITLVARNNNLEIITSGISKEDGFENELIKVESLSSGKLVRGIVKGKSRVEVAY